MLAECCCAQNSPPDVVLAAVWGHAVVSCKAAFGTGSNSRCGPRAKCTMFTLVLQMNKRSWTGLATTNGAQPFVWTQTADQVLEKAT